MVVGSGICCCCVRIDPVIAIVCTRIDDNVVREKRKDPVPQVVCWPGMPPVGSGSQFKSLKLNGAKRGSAQKLFRHSYSSSNCVDSRDLIRTGKSLRRGKRNLQSKRLAHYVAGSCRHCKRAQVIEIRSGIGIGIKAAETRDRCGRKSGIAERQTQRSRACHRRAACTETSARCPGNEHLICACSSLRECDHKKCCPGKRYASRQ